MLARQLTVLALAISVLASAPAIAGFCPKCANPERTDDEGKCASCGGATASSVLQLCPKCSAKTSRCERCGAPLKLSPPSPDTPLTLDAKANGKTMTAVVGQDVRLLLRGNASTGFLWRVAKVTGKAVQQQGRIEYRPDERKPGIAGGAGTAIARLKAVESGRSTVVCEYRRPWERRSAPERSFTVSIKVEKAPAEPDAATPAK